MAKTPSLGDLKKQIAMERSKVAKLDERIGLERELKKLKNRGRNDTVARIGRGLIVLGKGTARGAKAIQKFGEKRGAGQFFDTDLSGPSTSPKRSTRPVKRKKKKTRASGMNNMFGLDF